MLRINEMAEGKKPYSAMQKLALQQFRADFQAQYGFEVKFPLPLPRIAGQETIGL